MRLNGWIATMGVVAALFVTVGVRAQSTPRGMVQASQHPAELSLAAGVAVPLGKMEARSKLADHVRVAFPMTFGVGARLFRSLSVGTELSWGWADIGENAPWGSVCYYAGYRGTEQCSVRLTRVGVALAYHPLTAAHWDPWLGIGASYERLHFRGPVPPTASTDPNQPPSPGGVEFTVRGWSLESRVGMDYVLTSTLRAGAFLSFDVGRYAESDIDELRSDLRVPVIDLEFREQAFHYWIGGGVRLVFLGP
jgi:hypothetical protein